jgi:hypothetical protein
VGASGGLGSAIADELTDRGAVVIGAGRSGPDLHLDIRDSHAGDAVVRVALGTHGRLDGVRVHTDTGEHAGGRPVRVGRGRDQHVLGRDHRVTQALLEQFGQPLLATTLIAPGQTEPMNDAQEIRGHFQKQLQAVVDAGACPMQPTTVIDLTGPEPVILRVGRGEPARLGLRVDAAAQA